jgi:Cu-Zn family superoxide dismutase
MALVVVAASCSSEGPGESASRAVAELRPTRGNETRGIVEFETSGGRLLVSAHVDGLSPGAHGIHVHEAGDCSAPDATSAGPHFVFDATTDREQSPIAGNLGELDASATGKAGLERALERVSLDGPRGIIGRSVVVHSRGNDPSQPPDGDAGARIACGVIEVVSGSSG